MIRIAIVDDQTLLRNGLRSLLSQAADFDVVGEASDGDAALAVIRAVRPDVVLLDVRMPHRSGIAVLEALGADAPPTILLTTFEDDEALLAGVRAGARGVLLKDVSFEQVAEAIRRVAAGDTLIHPAVTETARRGLAQHHTGFESATLPSPLTPRELEVLRLLAGGHSNKEIAAALETSHGTIKNHASSIFAKLGVRDRTRAVIRALELGVI